MPQFSNSSGAMKNIQTQWGKNLSAVKYLFSQMTDGEPVFKKVKDDNPSTLFLRQRPTLEKSAEIPMDEADGKRMIQGFLSFKSASIICYLKMEIMQNYKSQGFMPIRCNLEES